MNRLIFYIVIDLIVAIVVGLIFSDAIVLGVFLIPIILIELCCEAVYWFLRKLF